MNRLRNRKKARDEPTPRPSVDSDASGPFKMFGRSKKMNDEPKPEIDLASALPPSDDFRTSLLMTGLSNRFSMLREQDDPHSKLGKSFDDSVLQPKRQSRMDFGLGTGLDDIAEDSSIKPPRRLGSYQSDDAESLTGTIMNRAKPTEGNNLFGGRQKIYKITATGSGRALYDDDVAQSAFQRWRQTERERRSLEEASAEYGNDSSGSLRPDSPPPRDFNRRRETSSTTSSAPSAARNSTAATSVTSSQPAPSLKDWQPPSVTAPNSTNSAPLPERSVTRTRRLYEQSLTQDLQEQQSSALSRIDTLAKNGSRGNRTPELTQTTTSPTGTIGSFERPIDRRPILSKASAPNLRSFSPTTPASTQPSPAENGSSFPGMELRTSHTTSPPLSPPVSENEEYPSLAIEPNDRGKATALGFFNRPAQRYDENRYAQRQRQLQQGRDTPTSRDRASSNASDPTEGSRSSSSLRGTSAGPAGSDRKMEPTAQGNSSNTTFLDLDNDDSGSSAAYDYRADRGVPRSSLGPPDEQDHPALRKSALPTPLSLSSRTSEDASDKPRDDSSPEDSPTLGPGAGLSGMVKQHLRNDSTASSVYGAVPERLEPDTYRPPSHTQQGGEVGDMGVESNPWGAENKHAGDQRISEDGEENGDFARHLADGARRVRERLTSYVDSDHSRSTSPSGVPVQDDYPPPPRTNAFSALRPKSSRGSLAERETRDQSRSRVPRIPIMSSSSQQSKTSMDGADTPHKDDVPDSTPEASDKPDSAHAGLKAFRQARRELQRMKEQEVQQRRQAPPAPQQPPPPPPPGGRIPSSSAERGPPPVSYNRVPSDETRGGPGSRPGSRARSDRDRSESETSNGPPRVPRLRTGPSAYDEHVYSPSSPSGGKHQMGRSATGDMRRSPAMPPYPGYDAAAGLGSRPGSSNGGHILTTSSTPNLPSSPSVPPPLPPINPRRKGAVQSMPPQDDGSRLPLTPERMRGARGPLAMPEEHAGPAQYRQRLRKVTNEANGGGAGGHPGWDKRPPYQTSQSSGNMPGGMI